MKKKLLAVLLFAVMMLTVCACGKKTIEDMISQSDIDAAATALQQQNANAYKSVDIKVSGNDITYTCVFADSIVITDAIKSQLQAMDWSSVIKSSKDEFSGKYNVEPGVITFIFYDSTGAEVLKISE